MTISSVAPGDVVNIDFPFSDGADGKNRPALVLSAPNAFGDFTVAMISSQGQDDGVPFAPADITHGTLSSPGFVRIRRIFTLHQDMLVAKRGILKATAMSKVLAKLCPSLGCKA